MVRKIRVGSSFFIGQKMESGNWWNMIGQKWRIKSILGGIRPLKNVVRRSHISFDRMTGRPFVIPVELVISNFRGEVHPYNNLP